MKRVLKKQKTKKQHFGDFFPPRLLSSLGTFCLRYPIFWDVLLLCWSLPLGLFRLSTGQQGYRLSLYNLFSVLNWICLLFRFHFSLRILLTASVSVFFSLAKSCQQRKLPCAVNGLHFQLICVLIPLACLLELLPLTNFIFGHLVFFILQYIIRD